MCLMAIIRAGGISALPGARFIMTCVPKTPLTGWSHVVFALDGCTWNAVTISWKGGCLVTEFFSELTEFAAELSEFSLPKQYSRNSIPPVS